MAHSAAPGPESKPPERLAQVLHGPWPARPAEPVAPIQPSRPPVCLEDLPPARPTMYVPPAPRVHCRAHWSSSPTAGYFLILGFFLLAFAVAAVLNATVFAVTAVG